ncbi:hypothetical protein TNCV_591331 [Trichonephila clavipes]|nr:hypothetical protein TNCV_591331 [Trichonephila clavipes]
MLSFSISRDVGRSRYTCDFRWGNLGISLEKGNNQEHSTTDPSTTIASSEAHTVSLNSPLKDLKRAIIQTLPPTPSANTFLAIENSKRKGKCVQSKTGEVLTNEMF